MIDAAFAELVPLSPKTAAYRILGKSRATLHRQENPKPAEGEMPARPWVPHSAKRKESRSWTCLTATGLPTSPQAQAWAVLLNEGRYYCSIRTMYQGRVDK